MALAELGDDLDKYSADAANQQTGSSSPPLSSSPNGPKAPTSDDVDDEGAVNDTNDQDATNRNDLNDTSSLIQRDVAGYGGVGGEAS